MLAALDWPQAPSLGLVVLAVVIAVLLLRGVGLAAHAAIWLTERIRGPEELYADRTSPGGAIGHRGIARTDLAPRGKVFVRGELWEAEAEASVSAGAAVEIVGVEGLVLRVRAADETVEPDRT